MKLMKWLLVGFGVLFLAAAAGFIGIYYWAKNVPAIAMSEADLAVGGSYPPEERERLLNACTRGDAKRTETCNCVADKAGIELSRYLRLVLTATLNGNTTEFVGITKGLIDSGVPHERVETLEQDADQQFDTLMKACGLEE